MSTFAALQLHPEVLKACRKQGFAAPLPIQSLVVPVVAAGKDAVVESATGSGKTLAYGLPLLSREPRQRGTPEVLVLVPTRELAEQVAAELTRSAGRLPRPVALLVGGGNMDRQRQSLADGAILAVGTLGRVEELLARGWLRLDAVRTLVLDEVDELLRGGFSANLAALLGNLPRDRQTLLFSATVPTEVETVARQFTRDAARLRLSKAREAPPQLKHRVLFTPVEDRLANLVGYLQAERPYQTIVFCGTRHETEELREALSAEGLDAEFLHGELSPLKRRQLLERFRTGDLPLLVASDLAARGLDLPGVDLIVNYSLPDGSAAYLHRAGRTGRAGRPGIVLSLVIGQQHTQFERLKETFSFESMEISSRGKLFSHPTRTREERDLIFRKAPPKPPPTYRRDPPPERETRDARSERPGRGAGSARSATGRPGSGRSETGRPAAAAGSRKAAGPGAGRTKGEDTKSRSAAPSKGVRTSGAGGRSAAPRVSEESPRRTSAAGGRSRVEQRPAAGKRSATGARPGGDRRTEAGKRPSGSPTKGRGGKPRR